jgi:hypothetical protein
MIVRTPRSLPVMTGTTSVGGDEQSDDLYGPYGI